MEKKYNVLKQLGDKGKEARTFLVEDQFKCVYAGKQFRKNKSVDKLTLEIEIQRKCADKLISPKIVGYDIKNKYIIMEKLDEHLVHFIIKNGGTLSETHQKELVRLFRKLDSIGVFQRDPNILNYMMRDGKIYMIDFGSVKYSKTKNNNMDVTLFGFILKMKEIGFSPQSYSYLSFCLSPDKQKIINNK